MSKQSLRNRKEVHQVAVESTACHGITDTWCAQPGLFEGEYTETIEEDNIRIKKVHSALHSCK
jgi:hypothetical protein